MRRPIYARSLDEARDEFEVEECTAMVRLIDALANLDWPANIAFDTSRLQFRIGIHGTDPLLVIAYANTRKYGIPINHRFESFDIVADVGGRFGRTNDLNIPEVVEVVGACVIGTAHLRTESDDAVGGGSTKTSSPEAATERDRASDADSSLRLSPRAEILSCPSAPYPPKEPQATASKVDGERHDWFRHRADPPCEEEPSIHREPVRTNRVLSESAHASNAARGNARPPEQFSQRST